MTVNHWVPGSSPGRGAKFKASVHTGAFFVAAGLSPGTTSRVIRSAHPFGAALKRVLLRSRVQVAEPNLKPQVKTWGFFVAAGLSLGTTPSLIDQISPRLFVGGATSRRMQASGLPANPHQRREKSPSTSPSGYTLLTSSDAPLLEHRITCSPDIEDKKTPLPLTGKRCSVTRDDYCSVAGSSASEGSALSASSPLMPSSSRSNTSTEFAGISGLGLCSP